MALDEPKTDDIKHEINGVRFIVAEREKHLVFGKSGVSVDYRDNFYGSGFNIRPLNGGSSCW
jgi:Fe-S cluster assembly iron-binding protein IscA